MKQTDRIATILFCLLVIAFVVMYAIAWIEGGGSLKDGSRITSAIVIPFALVAFVGSAVYLRRVLNNPACEDARPDRA